MPDLDTWVLTSADGTAVEYLSVGRGPHVIVVPGALAMASDLAAFATLLAERHAVHVVQRRGRGGSGPQGDRYGIARECEDVEAVRARTSARLIFGNEDSNDCPFLGEILHVGFFDTAMNTTQIAQIFGDPDGINFYPDASSAAGAGGNVALVK